MEENNDIKEEVPEELYAPLGNVSFSQTSNSEEVDTSPEENPKIDKNAPPEVISYQNVKLEYAKKPFDKQKWIRRLIILGILLLLGVSAFFYVKNKKNVFKKAWKAFSTVTVNTYYDLKSDETFELTTKKPFRTSYMINFDADYDETKVTKETKEFFDVLDSTAASETLEISYPDKKFTHAFRSTYLGGNILEFYGNGDQDGFTFKIREVLGKYVRVENPLLALLFEPAEGTKKDLQSFLNSISKITFQKIPEKQLKEEKQALKINDKTVKVRDIYVTLEEDQWKTDLHTLLKSLKENKTFLSKGAKISGNTETRFKEYVDEWETQLTSSWQDLKNVKIHVYAKGILNTIVGFKIEYQKGDLPCYWMLTKQGDGIFLTYQEKDQTILDFKFDQKEKTEIQVVGQYKDYAIRLTRYQKNNGSLYDYKITKENWHNYLEGSLVYQEETDGKGKDGSIRLTMQALNQHNDDIASIHATVNFSMNPIDKLNLYDDEGYTKYEALDEKARQEMKKRVQKTEYYDLLKTKYQAFEKKLQESLNPKIKNS